MMTLNLLRFVLQSAQLNKSATIMLTFSLKSPEPTLGQVSGCHYSSMKTSLSQYQEL